MQKAALRGPFRNAFALSRASFSLEMLSRLATRTHPSEFKCTFTKKAFFIARASCAMLLESQARLAVGQNHDPSAKTTRKRVGDLICMKPGLPSEGLSAPTKPSRSRRALSKRWTRTAAENQPCAWVFVQVPSRLYHLKDPHCGCAC